MPVVSTASYFIIPLNLSPFEQAEYGIPLLWPKEEARELLRGTGTQMYLLYSNKVQILTRKAQNSTNTTSVCA
jgi:hypothetical protein